MQSLHTSLLTTEELTNSCARHLPLINPLLTGQSILLATATAAETKRDATQLTRNLADFNPAPGLRVENWLD